MTFQMNTTSTQSYDLMKPFYLILLMAISTHALSVEHFVRPDGGTLDQCNGQTNAAYSVSVINKQCAVKHLFELLDPQSKDVHINGGDIVTIMNNSDGSPAEYEMGMHAEYTSGGCHSGWNYDCTTAPIPSGTVENPTIIRGVQPNGVCSTKPVLSGTGRASKILSIDAANHIEVSCLTITDKSSCIGAGQFPDSSLICDRSSPYNKPFADTGILIRDADDIHLTDLDIKGLSTGIVAGRLGDITLTRVNIHANHSAGWNGDIAYMGGDGSSNTGTTLFKDSLITFSGCGLIYDPGSSKHNTPHACARQDIGGYGDGLGTGETGGDWVFENTKIMHNASDGLDLLYHSLGGKITLKNSRFEGNAGNQVKISGNAELINNIIIGNCSWNASQEAYIGAEGEICRAQGNALSLSYTHSDTRIDVINNTVISEGDCLLSSGNRTNVAVGSQTLNVINNLFYALPDYRQSTYENSCMYYTENPFPIKQIHNNIIHKVKGYDNPCDTFQANIPSDGEAGLCSIAQGPYFENDDLSVETNPHYASLSTGIRYGSFSADALERESNNVRADDRNSPLINAGYERSVSSLVMPSSDYYGNPRVAAPDIGAVEYVLKPKPPIIVDIKE